MQKNPQMTVFSVLVAALAFYGALPFWWNLGAGEGSGGDLMAPIAYGFAALFGALYLVRLSRDKQRPKRERTLYVAAAIVLLVAPFLFHFLSGTPVIGILWPILEWAAGLALVAGLVLLARNKELSKVQRAAVIASLVAAIIAPSMPWMPALFNAGILPEGVYFPLWQYGVWIVAIVWCAAAWLMLPKLPVPWRLSQAEVMAANLAKMRSMLTKGLILGLGIFMGGMANPVQYASHTYEQRTYFAGRLTDTSIVDIPDLNMVLLAGMGLIMFPLLLMMMPMPGTQPLPGTQRR